MNRKEPTLTAKLAACVRELLGIPFEHARLMTAEQMLSLVQWDHILYWSQNKHEPWVDDHFNIEARPIRGHREKTAKVDLPQMGKTRRISREQEEFRQRMLTPREERPVRKSRIQSRGFEKRRKKT